MIVVIMRVLTNLRHYCGNTWQVDHIVIFCVDIVIQQWWKRVRIVVRPLRYTFDGELLNVKIFSNSD